MVEENGLVEKFDRAVEGILLPLVCLVGVLGAVSSTTASPKHILTHCGLQIHIHVKK